MSEVIAFVSVKGGVGKTTVALEVASVLANYFDKRILLIDANFSAPNLHMYLGLEQGEIDMTLHDVLNNESGGVKYSPHNAIYEKHGVDIVPAIMSYKKGLDIFQLKKIISRVNKRYDFIIIDSSPHYSELLPVVAAADRIFVVTTPDEPTLKTSLMAAKIAKKQNTPIEGIIINKIRNPRYELSLGEIEEQGEIPVVARIKDHKKMAKALHHREPISLHDRKNKISKEIERFANSLSGIAEESSGFFQSVLPFTDIGKEKVNRELMRKKFK